MPQSVAMENRRDLLDPERREMHANLADRMQHLCDRLASRAKVPAKSNSWPSIANDGQGQNTNGGNDGGS